MLSLQSLRGSHGEVQCLADGLGKDCPAPDPSQNNLVPGTLCCDYCKVRMAYATWRCMAVTYHNHAMVTRHA